ncbi:hypothetical protein K488DRAFT_15142, partial [Vararia minispora EC-137]
ELYASQMSSLKRGYALFDPHPGFDGNIQLRRPVGFGDVGYVSEAGAFRRLFSVHLPLGHEDQPEQLPDDFEYIPVQPGRVDLRDFQPQALRSVTSRRGKVSAGVDVYVPAVPATGDVSLSFSRQQGAILAFFDKAWHEDSRMKKEYKRLFLKHHDAWLAYAQEEDPDLRMEDLVLVTGCDRTRTWATAVIDDVVVEGDLTLKVNLQNLGGISVTCGLRWERTHGAQCNWGPSR